VSRGCILEKTVGCYEKSLLFCPAIAQSTKEAKFKWHLNSVDDSKNLDNISQECAAPENILTPRLWVHALTLHPTPPNQNFQ